MPYLIRLPMFCTLLTVLNCIPQAYTEEVVDAELGEQEALDKSPLLPKHQENLKELLDNQSVVDKKFSSNKLDASVSLNKQEQAAEVQAESDELAGVKPAENIDLSEPVIKESPKPDTELLQQPELVDGAISDPVNIKDRVNIDSVDPIESPVKSREDWLFLNTLIPPGTTTRLSWSPDQSFEGIATPSPVLVAHGLQQGPKLCLTGAVHGDELNGIEIVRRVLYSIDASDLHGTVIGVPIVNLQGFLRASRYLTDRRDLNRFFPGTPTGSSASRIAYSFYNQVIKHCDMLVDLHTGSFYRTNLPQLRANLKNHEVLELSRSFDAIAVLHSEGAVGTLRRAAVDAGIPAVTFEAGGPMELSEDNVSQGVKAINTLLDKRGMLDTLSFWGAPQPTYYGSLWVRADQGGILFSEIELGDKVAKDKLLGVVTDPITNIRSEIISPVKGRVIGMALNQVVQPGFAAYHIGMEAEVDEDLAEGELPPVIEETQEVSDDELVEEFQAHD
ncbi:succinylglutamate desuccinylase/aspartoacylase family protein [Agaribacterium sp. ZY112]|uniref:succinylglutamate desuccinylase/aspartoacylase family protein n=1 Tax=Agaribacterium sp. ZY112 TaxID=3233574 RepID=UPI003524C3DD